MRHILTNICSIAFLFVGLLLIFVILLQRGRGGGLAGAFGGAGGQSAFGTKAGDVFTRITIGVFILWLGLAVLTGYAMSYESSAHRLPLADSSNGGTEGAVEATKGGPVNPNEAGSEEAKTPSNEAPKATGSSQKSAPAPADKSAPATNAAPATKGPSTTPADKKK